MVNATHELHEHHTLGPELQNFWIPEPPIPEPLAKNVAVHDSAAHE